MPGGMYGIRVNRWELEKHPSVLRLLRLFMADYTTFDTVSTVQMVKITYPGCIPMSLSDNSMFYVHSDIPAFTVCLQVSNNLPFCLTA